MRFADAEEFLGRQRRFGWIFGLGPMRRALARLGHPERSLPAVVIAGSKGKGSTAAFLEAILLAAGHRAGLYTSPHLVDVRERIRTGGRAIGARAFGRLIGELRARLGARARLTHFEWLTLAGIVHFAQVRAWPAILEIGLGGRLDAVNAVDGALTVITGIEREHVDLLGRRLGGIATEKAGVMRRGVPCVIGAVRPAARAALAACASRSGARPIWLERAAAWRITRHDRRGVRLDLTLPGAEFPGLRLGLLGRHQAHNAALAVLAAAQLRAQGWSIPDAAVRRGLAAARWPGRCDYRPGKPGLLLDGSHTAGSARALADVLGEVFPRTRTVLVFGALRDKSCAAMTAALFPRAAAVHLVRPPEERGLEPAELLRRVPPPPRGRCRPAPGTAAALAAARRDAGPGGLVVVAGSL
ncbi:MAG TPA: cyanophycin synthetase, partial [Candidatus Methanoperedens sp.]|nr:cyanophycin synthetase [Candidatus Methanoperedens sp.]